MRATEHPARIGDSRKQEDAGGWHKDGKASAADAAASTMPPVSDEDAETELGSPPARMTTLDTLTDAALQNTTPQTLSPRADNSSTEGAFAFAGREMPPVTND
ncbi:unnamed protein product, partial [Discosporangium mesarthrocarpum]